MNRFLKAAILWGASAALFSTSRGEAQVPRQQPDLKSAFTTADFSSLPAMSRGKSTVLGGQIANVDPVLDQLTLRV